MPKKLAKDAGPPYTRLLGRQRRTDGRDVAQPGSASHWGCGGRRFESSRPDQFQSFTSFGLIQKLVHIDHDVYGMIVASPGTP